MVTISHFIVFGVTEKRGKFMPLFPHTATPCHQYLQFVEKARFSAHKFKHEDYNGLARQVLAYPVTYKALSGVTRK